MIEGVKKYEEGTVQHTKEQEFLNSKNESGKPRVVVARFRNEHGEPFTIFGDMDGRNYVMLGSETSYEPVKLSLRLVADPEFAFSAEEEQAVIGLLNSITETLSLK